MMKYGSIETKAISVLLYQYRKTLETKQLMTSISDFQAIKRSVEIDSGVSRYGM